MTSFWNQIDMKTGACRLWQAGHLRIWVWCVNTEWRVASEQLPELVDEVLFGTPTEPPVELEWSRWRGGKIDGLVQLLPTMPDRPLVARPDEPLNILPAHTESFCVSIPLWVRVVIGSGPTIDILESASQKLSNTWFGDSMQGELCYSLSTRARHEEDEVSIEPLSASCKIVIKNEHHTPLNFERICLRAEYLSIYQTESGFFTNEVLVGYQGQEQMSRIKYSKRAPLAQGKIVKIGEARRPIEENILKKSFSSLLSHTFDG